MHSFLALLCLLLANAAGAEPGIRERVGETISRDLTFRTEGNAPIKLGEITAGKPTILSLVYYGCPSICGLLLSREAQALRQLGPDAAADFQVVVVSIDPRETPALAERSRKAFAELSGRTQDLHFLTGTETQIRALADQVGFSYAFDLKSGVYLHEAALIFLDPTGKITRYVRGTNFKSKDLLGEEPARPAPEPGLCSPLYFTSLDDFRPLLAVQKDLATRATEQKLALSGSSAFRGFQFEDRILQSGISFVNRPVTDAAVDYKPVHYDHGTGVAAADVDGDGLPDLYFLNQQGKSELWRNRGKGRFENITERAGVGMKGRIPVGASFGDFDNDGKPDLFVTTVRHGNSLFRNLGGGVFREVTHDMGLAGTTGHASGAVWFDYNRDGFLDLFVAQVGKYTNDTLLPEGNYEGLWDAFFGHLHPERFEKSLLYRNEGGKKFVEVSAEMGLVNSAWSGDAIAFDANQDGFPDLYVLNMQGRNHLFINHEGKKFSDETETYFKKTSWGAMGVQVLDFDGDGNADVFVTDMHSDMLNPWVPKEGETRKLISNPRPDLVPETSHSIFGNSFFKGKADHSYEEVSDAIGVETYWPWGPSAGDLNADGYEDVFITAGMNFPFRYQANSLLLNESGKRFAPAEFALGVEPRKELVQEWFRVDCRQKPKNLVCAACPRSPAGVACPGTDKNGVTHVLGSKASRSSVILDLDGDGDLDIVTNEYGASPQILISNLAQKGKSSHWLKLRLTGTASNRAALGAVVRLKAAGRWQTRFRTGKSGYLSQSDLPLYFGLGDAREVEAIEITWPSGLMQKVAGPIKGDRDLSVVEEQPGR